MLSGTDGEDLIFAQGRWRLPVVSPNTLIWWHKQRATPHDQGYYLAQVVLDSDRSENAWLGNELRVARTESERIEREKRAAASSARTTHFASTPQAVMSNIQPQYYRGYSYAYPQAYGNTTPTSASPAIPQPPTTSTNYSLYQPTGAIPVQLPVASLPALHALGIVPVPATSLPPEGQPQPAAVLRGCTANGAILSLEINVSLLQSAQMSGLAMMLNSLVSRSSAAASSTSAPTPVGNSVGTPTNLWPFIHCTKIAVKWYFELLSIAP
jgi:hypothetical protein